MAQLTPRQARFVQEYLTDLNATAACVRAGYSAKTAYANSSQLLAKPQVRDAVEAAMAKRAERLEVKADDVLRELLRIARCDVGQAFRPDGTLLPLHEMPEDVRRAISGFEVEELYEGADGEKFSLGKVKKVKFWDKTRGLELLGKHLRLFTDKVEHSGSVTVIDPYAMAPGE
jgi:phage terminase small subunit